MPRSSSSTPSSCTHLLLAVCVAVVTLSVVMSSMNAHAQATTVAASPKRIMYAWVVGSNGNPDFVAVVDFDRTSLHFGIVLSRHFLPSNDPNVSPTGNEPHHMGIDVKRKRLVLGGLLSFTQGKHEIFVFDISDPLNPTFLKSFDAPNSACIDEFSNFKNGFLVTAMCNEAAGSPGLILYIDLDAMVISPLGHQTPPADYNPHGFDHNSQFVMVGDYVLPSSLIPDSTPSASDIVFHNTVRIFNRKGKLLNTLMAPGAGGFMDLKLIPGTSTGLTAGGLDNQLYFVDASAGAAAASIEAVFDMTSVNGGTATLSAGIQRITKNGQFAVMTYALRYVLSFRLVDGGRAPQLVQSFDLCSLSTVNCTALNNVPGSHYIIFTKTESQFVVINYFLKFGLAQFPGSQSIHAFNFDRETGKFAPDANFQLSFLAENAFPHAAQFLEL